MKVLVSIVIAATLCGTPGFAKAQTAVDNADLRCLLAMAAASGSEPSREVGSLGTFFYLGRILAIEPTFDFSTRLKPVASAMTQSDLPGEIRRCGLDIKAASEGMKAAQDSLNGKPSAPRG